ACTSTPVSRQIRSSADSSLQSCGLRTTGVRHVWTGGAVQRQGSGDVAVRRCLVEDIPCRGKQEPRVPCRSVQPDEPLSAGQSSPIVRKPGAYRGNQYQQCEYFWSHSHCCRPENHPVRFEVFLLDEEDLCGEREEVSG